MFFASAHVAGHFWIFIMTSLHQLAPLGVRHCLVLPQSRTAKIENRLGRFSVKHRAAIRALSAKHPALADLALSFPALLFALAVPRAGFSPGRVIEQVVDGCGLSDLAKLAGLPKWLRKLPPEAFAKPIGMVLGGELFVRRIGNHIPRSPKLVANWLEAVSDATMWGHEAFAVWVARIIHKERKVLKLERRQRLALWAWYSLARDTEGFRLIETPWTPTIGLEQAVAASRLWLETIELHANIGQAPIADMWLQSSYVDGYEFVALRTAREIAEEAVAMRNCLRTYGESIALDRARIWSIRKAGTRVACIELGISRGDELPSILQIKLSDNKKAPRDIALVARQWLNAHDLTEVKPSKKKWGTKVPDRKVWLELWRPYWLAKQALPNWLPLAPSSRVLNGLMWG
jgi:hypothetical protein